MSLPPRGDEQPTAAWPGHPTEQQADAVLHPQRPPAAPLTPVLGHPDPVPLPEPGPPQPIPPPEPVPVPEPPHAFGPPPEPTGAAEQFGSGERPSTVTPPTGEPAGMPFLPDPPTMPRAAEPVAAPELATAAMSAPGPPIAPVLDAPEPAVTYPPVGAYPGEPGHPEHPATEPVGTPPVDAGPAHGPAGHADQPTQWQPAITSQGESVQPGRSEPVDPQSVWQAPIPPGHHNPAHEWHPEQGQQWHPGAPQHGRPHPHAQPQPPPSWQSTHPPYEVPLVPEPPPAGRRTALWVSLALAFTLLLCAGGAISAFLLLRNAEAGDGAPDPQTAVTRFLTAVYSEQDATAANDLVCREARDDKKMSAKVDEVRNYAREYDGPRFRWDEPAIATEDEERATVSVEITMTTDDEKTAQQQLTFTVVKKTGWWVCEVAG